MNIGAPLLALAVCLSGLATADDKDNAKQLLKLTGGRRVKVVWNQGAENAQKVMFLDTKDGVIQELPIAMGSAPLLTQDGRWVLVSAGKAPNDRKVIVYDIESKKTIETPAGPGNNLLAVWQDPKTKRTWVYVNDCGDKGEQWNVPAGKIFRFTVDKPAERELFWERTSSHIYLMFSADGTRACMEPNWSNIGQLNVVYDAQGKCDQDKSTFKPIGGGCFPSLAPDNSYRMFRLEGDHRAISMTDADGANPRKVEVTGMLTEAQKANNTWLTRWSADPRFLTLVAPAGPNAQIWMGRFDENVTKIEEWARVSAEKGPQCWQSHAWVEPGTGTRTAATGSRGVPLKK
jgi:hypothetical protein